MTLEDNRSFSVSFTLLIGLAIWLHDCCPGLCFLGFLRHLLRFVVSMLGSDREEIVVVYAIRRLEIQHAITPLITRA